VKIGIIGAENSHGAAIARTLNVEKAIRGVSVDCIWGETPEFAKAAAEKGSIPNIVERSTDMMGRIDALVVDHRHAKHHLNAAMPYLLAGVPMFIDKPFCYRVAEGRDFLRIAARKKVPVTSYSTVPLSRSAEDLKKAVDSLGDLYSIQSFGPCDVDSVYGGVFFCGVHQVELVLELCGCDVVSVLMTRNGNCSTGQMLYKSGAIATLNFVKAGWPSFGVTVLGSKKAHHQVLDHDKNPYLAGIRLFVTMFRTGREPVKHDRILKTVEVLESLEKSDRTGKPVRIG
jgi:predicted dehydrogenase